MQTANGTNGQFKGRLDLAPHRGSSPEFRRTYHRRQHLPDITSLIEKGLRHFINQALRRVITDKPDRDLAADKTGRGSMMRQHLQQVNPFLAAAVRPEMPAQYRL